MTNFDKFWRAYPKRWKRKEALKVWDELGIEKNEALVFKIIDAINRFRKSDQWRKSGGQFIPLPANFLREERWLDDLDIDIEENKPRW